MATSKPKVCIIGCGNMGSALARGLSKNASVALFDRHFEKSQKLAVEIDAKAVQTVAEAVQNADFVILAIKPKDFLEVAREIASRLEQKCILISVLAGVTQEQLEKEFSKTTIVRAMPNLSVSCGKGVTGFVEDPRHPVELREKLTSLFAPTGMTLFVPENKIDALMSLTACAPAFIALLIEAFTEGGIYLGLPSDQALSLVLRVFDGTLALMEGQGLHPADLRWQVASPGGTTIEGLKVLEEYRVHYAIMQALIAATNKAKKS